MEEDRDRPKPAPAAGSGSKDGDDREARLAAALRANLRRRKAALKPPPAER